MKKISFLSGLILLFSLFSCRTTKTNAEYSKIIPRDLPVCELGDKEWDFTLMHSLESVDHIVVNLKIGDSTYFFCVDTGCIYNCFYGTPDPVMEVSEGGTVKIFALNTEINGINSRISFKNYGENILQVDGMIGYDFLKNYKNVVIDYRNLKIYFDAEPITESSIPIINLTNYTPVIEFSADGKKEYGIIDTGSSIFVIRENFGDGNAVFNRDELLKAGKTAEVIERSSCEHKIIGNLSISDVNYKEMFSYDWNSDRFIILNKASINSHRKISLLGTPFWHNHVIQLDFYNNEFRIK